MSKTYSFDEVSGCYIELPIQNTTKREYFAAMAMQGLIGSGFATDCRQASALAIDHADALLAEMENKSSNPPSETL